MNDEIEVLNGQVSALNIVLAQCLSGMQRDAALHALIFIEIERSALRKVDLEENTSPIQAKTREAILSSYVDLLKAASSFDK